MTAAQTPSTLLALHDADPEGLNRIACPTAITTDCEACYGGGELGGEGNAYRCPDCRGTGKCAPRYIGPKYSTSLDAVAELEAGLTDEEHYRFQGFLYDLTLAVLLVFPPFKPHERKKVERAYISAPAHLRLIAWMLTKQTI